MSVVTCLGCGRREARRWTVSGRSVAFVPFITRYVVRGTVNWNETGTGRKVLVGTVLANQHAPRPQNLVHALQAPAPALRITSEKIAKCPLLRQFARRPNFDAS